MLFHSKYSSAEISPFLAVFSADVIHAEIHQPECNQSHTDEGIRGTLVAVISTNKIPIRSVVLAEIADNLKEVESIVVVLSYPNFQSNSVVSVPQNVQIFYTFS